MVNYKNGKIYKIVCDTTGLVYVGSTCEVLSKRLTAHRQDLKRNKPCRSSLVLANGDYKIVLIEEYPCENREQLLRRERYWFDNTPNCNKLRPFRTMEEKAQQAQDYNNKITKETKDHYNNLPHNIQKRRLNYLLKKELGYYLF